MQKILITGATGFIGNYVMKRLLLQGDYQLVASSALVEHAKQQDWYPLVKYIPFNIKEYDARVDYYEYFDRPDLMIHLAWEGLPNYKSSFHLEENLPRHFEFLKNCLVHGLKDLTVTGTCLEYGMQEGCLREDMATRPDTAYAIAKDVLRKNLEELQAEMGFSFKWIRLFYMFGQGQSPNSLLSQLERALEQGEENFNMSGGEQERDYLPVEKVADYIVQTALQNKVTGIVNCCSGIPITVKKFVEDYLAQNKKQIHLNLGYYPYADYEPMSFWGNNNKIKTIIDNE